MLTRLSVNDVRRLVDNNTNILFIIKKSMGQRDFVEFRKALRLVLIFINEPEKIILTHLKNNRPDLYSYIYQDLRAMRWLVRNMKNIKENI